MTFRMLKKNSGWPCYRRFYDNERRILRYQERERFHRKEIAYNRQLVLATAIFAGLLLISLVAVLYGYRQKQEG